MSYDLYFRKKEQESLSRDEFKEYFEPRRNYKVEDKQAIYENEDTGVYFSFHYTKAGSTDKESEFQTKGGSASFNLNFLRPHIFALEAEPEVASFVETFGFLVDDPQINGNASAIYTSEDFIRGWNAGNKFAYESIGKSNPEIRNVSLPAVDIERYWRWNYNLNSLRKEKGEGIFVPRIMFHFANGQVKSFITWSDAIPTVFPVVDTIIIFRDELAPQKSFSIKKEADLSILNYNDVLPIWGDIPTIDAPLPYKVFQPANEKDNKAREWIASLKGSSEKPDMVSVDHILDKELI